MNKFELPDNPELAKTVIEADAEHKRFEAELGYLGRLFGCNPSLPVYIAGAIASLSVAAGFAYTFLPDSWKTSSTADFWKIISPIVMTCLAYIFGASKGKATR